MDFSKLKCSQPEEIIIKNKSNIETIKEKNIRLTLTRDKPMTIDYMNEAVKEILKKYYKKLKGDAYKNKTVEFNFCTKNEKSFGITDWINIDYIDEEDIDDININKTFSLYEGDEKVFIEDIERDKFWLTFRIRDKIGYGLQSKAINKSDKYCFFKALFDANIIGIRKRKLEFENGNASIYKYDSSIQDVYNHYIEMIKNKNKYNERFKHLERIIYIDDCGGVKVEDMPKLEKIFECNIFINDNNSYEPKYKSPEKYNKSVYLVFKDGHFSLEDKHKKENKIIFDDSQLYSQKKNKILIVDKGVYYDGEDFIQNPTSEEIKKIMKNKFKINFDKFKKTFKEDLKGIDNYYDKIKELYKLFDNDCKELEEEGLSILNSYSLQKYLFFELVKATKHINIKCEPVEDFAEYKILNEGTTGGYNYVYEENKIFEDVYSYDVKSAYPGALVHPDFKIPIKRGQFMNKSKYFYNDLEKGKLQYGIYKCKITKNNNGNNKTFSDFRINKNNVYTHYDILLAKKLGYNIELLNESLYPYIKNEENKPLNSLIYTVDKLIDSSDIFNSVVRKLYKIKQEHKQNKIIKILLSGIWGYLCDDKTYKKGKATNINNTFTIEKDDKDEILYEKPINDNNKEIEYYFMSCDNLTKTALFRLKPFLLAFQKLLIYDDIKKAEKEGGKILKVKTDGIYTNKEIEAFEKRVKGGKICEGEIVRGNYYKYIIFLNKTKYKDFDNKQDLNNYIDNL